MYIEALYHFSYVSLHDRALIARQSKVATMVLISIHCYLVFLAYIIIPIVGITSTSIKAIPFHVHNKLRIVQFTLL